MHTIKTTALGILAVLVGTQCFGAADNHYPLNDYRLIEAARNGNTEVVQKLLDTRANANISYYRTHSTPLTLATINGHGETMRILLDAGAKIDKKNGNGHTPLMLAIMYNRAPMVQILIDAKADTNKSNNQGKKALDIAIESYDKNAEIIRILKNSNATTSRNTRSRL